MHAPPMAIDCEAVAPDLNAMQLSLKHELRLTKKLLGESGLGQGYVYFGE